MEYSSADKGCDSAGILPCHFVHSSSCPTLTDISSDSVLSHFPPVEFMRGPTCITNARQVQLLKSSRSEVATRSLLLGVKLRIEFLGDETIGDYLITHTTTTTACAPAT